MTGSENRERAESAEFGRIPLQAFLEFWRNPVYTRFRYRPIRIVSSLLSLVLGALWAFYLYTLVTQGFSLPLVLFGILLLLFSLLTGARIMAWRLFVVRSAIVVTPEALLWRHGPDCFLAPWDLIDPQALGLGEAAFSKGYDRFLRIRVHDHEEPLYLVRLYGHLDGKEAFLAELFRHIPRDKWKSE